MRPTHSRFTRMAALLLAAAIVCSACASSVVQIRPPYAQKLRPGDGVKVTTKKGTLFSGRVLYLDSNVLILRTPRQTITEKPVKTARFGQSIPWETIGTLRVAGTLDSQKKLISNEEIRINRRTNLRQKLMANVGLLGLATSFLIGASIQEHIAPADPDNLVGNHGHARFSFWSTVLLGTAASVGIGYKVGDILDNRQAIDRIERFRVEARQKGTETALGPGEETVFGRPLAR